ncbi:RNA polymerase sigma factor [Niabella drilacis]|uniref:RNA polymerase sigma-70 factor, ECF subfamily n=1 Tax=Niabella drilacis (strain DSM 25811 / CCM 8410 / CCUG 62505 / LMG 26954 / E90) TaxID=1285928 RepID=A0A1G6L4U3_NIADE|nr:sigma-70 family RNA polymerase sigma factor [Niabella drilacis]SDC38151.1 RNA polymerase sigma-70 factor, ECF subfamily [Niabella drilacis]
MISHELLRLVAAGDERSFRVLFEEYKDRFYAVALKMTASDVIAEEMVQDIFIKIWQKRAELATIEHLDAYFFTTLYRQVYKYYKKLALDRKLLKLIAESPRFHNITEETLLLRESERLINEAVTKLPQQQQKVFRLSRQDGFSREQIAEQLHISPNTVRNHLADATRFIRTYLDKAALVYMLMIFNNIGK